MCDHGQRLEFLLTSEVFIDTLLDHLPDGRQVPDIQVEISLHFFGNLVGIICFKIVQERYLKASSALLYVDFEHDDILAGLLSSLHIFDLFWRILGLLQLHLDFLEVFSTIHMAAQIRMKTYRLRAFKTVFLLLPIILGLLMYEIRQLVRKFDILIVTFGGRKEMVFTKLAERRPAVRVLTQSLG